MSFLSWIFVPKCVSCKRRLSHDTDYPLCPECLLGWEREKNAVCPMCGRAPDLCACGLTADTDHMIRVERHLSYYSPSQDSVTKSLVFSIKENLNALSVKMLADELAEMISGMKTDEGCVIAHVPRSPRSARYYGFDQTLELAKRVCAALEIPRITPIVHRGRAVQKNLNFAKRRENVKKSYFLADNAKELIDKRPVILLDDIITTGATASYCARLLHRAGAPKVYFVSIAKSYR